MTYFVEPLAPGEEAITEYLPVESTDSTDELCSSSMASMTEKRMAESSSGSGSLVKNRSPSLFSTVSFSLIESPTSNDVQSLRRKNYLSQQKKVSVDSNTSVSHMVTVPIIEESSGQSSGSSLPSNNVRRNQVSPFYNEDGVIPDSSFHEEAARPTNGKRRNSRKKCTIC